MAKKALSSIGVGRRLRIARGAGGANLVFVPSCLVSELPNAAEAGAGARGFVTDADSTTFAAAAVGSSTNKMPVFSDGSSWKIG